MKKTKDNSEKADVDENEKKSSAHKRVKAEDKEGSFIFQSNGKDYTVKDIKKMCVESYRGNTRKRIDTIDVYVKFEDGTARAYYVVNGKANGAYIEL